ncbi:MAG: glycosyltransferase [Flavobacteriales bacterium]
MHVVFLPKYYPGRRDPQLGEFIRRHALALAPLAQVSVVAVLKDPEMLVPYEEEVVDDEGVWTLRAYYRPVERGPGLWRTPKNLLRYWRATKMAWRRFRHERGTPQLVHVHVLTRPALLAMRTRRREGIPFLITEHSSEFMDGRWQLRGAVHRSFTRRAFKKARVVMVVSQRLGKALENQRLVDLYEVVPNVLPLEQVQVARRGEAHKAIVVADLVDRVKNISGVLEAMALLRDTLPQLRLTIVGGGSDERRLRELCTGFNLDDRVTFTGQLAPQQTLAEIAASGFLIVNSRTETFSVVTGEALMLGRPVIATRCGGPEAFVDQRNGTLIPVDNTAALAEAIKKVVATYATYDPEVIRATLDERYSAEAIGKQIFNIYQRVLAKRT